MYGMFKFEDMWTEIIKYLKLNGILALSTTNTYIKELIKITLSSEYPIYNYEGASILTNRFTNIKLAVNMYSFDESIRNYYPLCRLDNLTKLNVQELCEDDRNFKDAILPYLINLQTLKVCTCKKMNTSNLTRLRSLTMTNCAKEMNVTDDITMGKTNLTSLCLYYVTTITNKGLMNLRKLKKLKLRDISDGQYNYNYIDDDAFKHLNELEELTIKGYYDITSDILNYLPKLRTLKAEHTFYEGETFAGKINKVPYLDVSNIDMLYYDDLSQMTSDEIRRFTNLEYLWLCDNEINVTDETLLSLTNLTDLDLTNNTIITDNAVSKLINLTCLNIYGSNITNVGISSLHRLKALHIDKERTISSVDIQNLTNLQQLGRNKIEKMAVSEIIESFDEKIEEKTRLGNLFELKLMNNDLIKMKLLKKLKLHRNANITDEALSTATTLKTLILRDNAHISNKGIYTLINLQYLDITKNKVITDDALKKLVNLKTLLMRKNHTITNKGVRGLTELHRLNFTDYGKITMNTLTKLRCLKYIRIHKNKRFIYDKLAKLPRIQTIRL